MNGKQLSSLVPKLRFPEFVGEPAWERIGLIKLAKRITQRNSQGAHLRTLTNSAERGIVDQREYFDRDITTNIDNYYIVEQGDFVYNPRISSAAPVGPISKNQIGTGVVSPLYTVFRFRNQATEFFAHYFRSSHWHGYLRGVANSGARHDRMAITNDDLMRMPIPTPSPREQQKIADCLGSLDDLIAAEGRKLEALRQHKRGLVQQLFPELGETLPQTRFPEFRDQPAWQVRKISELLEKVAIELQADHNTSYREIGVRSHGRGVFHKAATFGSLIGEKRVFQVIENALVFNIVFAWEGAVATTSPAEAGMIASHRFPMYVPRSGAADVRFMKYAFLTRSGAHLLHVASPGGAGRNRTLGKSDLEKLTMIVPGREEQAAIANALDAVGELIDLQINRVNALALHKQGLLQQLFPSPEEEPR